MISVRCDVLISLIYSIIEIDMFLTLVFSAEKKNSEKNERIIRDDNDC
jgi:hypothetical protein